MARNKQFPRKRRQGKASTKAENVPTWVVMKTKGKVRRTPYSQRHWRRTRLSK